MKGYITKGMMKYKMKYLLQSTKEVEIDVGGQDMDIDSAKKVAQVKAEEMAARLGNNFKVLACVEVVGKRDK
jgi:hypothetical protein